MTVVNGVRLIILACACALSACATNTDADFCSNALDVSRAQLEGFRNAYDDPTRIPRSWNNGDLRLVAASDWTSGFVAGSFWLTYDHTRDPSWLASAQERTAALESQKAVTSHHDVGFMINNSFGHGVRLTGNPRYELTLVHAADSLLTRFDQEVGAIRSWDFGTWGFPVIIDNMMNLELLYVASDLSGDPKYADIANHHALTTLENHFRPDHSSYHVVDYDSRSGQVARKQTHQGIADESSWSRGQAWGLYGFTMAYRFARDERFLDQARNIAEFYLDHPNLPEDHIPFFDFDVPNEPSIENIRDSSAAAITASALLELAGYVTGSESSRYKDAALSMLRSLSSPEYLAKTGENGHFLLMHATGRWQADDEVDAAINYADYYYLEALHRCARPSRANKQ